MRGTSGLITSLVLAVSIFALAPSAAWAGNPQCSRLTRQIAHFEDVVEMAQDRNNDLWENATLQHIDRLQTKRARLCPQYDEELAKKNAAARAAQQTAKFLKAAGEVALRVFTAGTFPGF